MVIFHSFWYVYQRVNLHFPMVVLWFSHFPMVFPSPHLDDGFPWTLAILTRGPEDLLWLSHHAQTTTGCNKIPMV